VIARTIVKNGREQTGRRASTGSAANRLRLEGTEHDRI